MAALLGVVLLTACANNSNEVAADQAASAPASVATSGPDQHTTAVESSAPHPDPTPDVTAAGHDHSDATAAASTATTASGVGRLPPDQESALVTLAAASAPLDHAGHGAHPHGHTFGPADEVPMDDADAAMLDTQWAVAAATAEALATPTAAGAAGYVQASVQLPGVGAHWVNWMLVDTPFDPATPSMLLYDQTDMRPHSLAGFSYWVRSETVPEGFAGPNDVWHQHAGLCFTNGWLVGEDVPAATDCAGHWLNGADLWMLHAWVVPEFENSWGRFAARNPALCPPDSAQLPDLLTCDPELV